MRPFKRRVYHGLGQFWGEFRYLLANRHKLRAVMRGGLVSFAFRERLMLAVTSVNRCRYCTYYHSKLALESGLEPAEMHSLLGGGFEGSPPEEAPALLYAQHWAETEGRPDPEAVRRLTETYGPEKAEAIDLVLRAIRMGNLSGNTFDYFLHLISFGRWGRYEPGTEGQGKQV
ncbi:MAG: carboxymuconolactone decarboxylase family protein [Bacillota bacterium]